MINERNAYFHEYIGSKVEIISSSNLNNVGLKGIIADETKKTIKIKTGDAVKVIPKSTSELLITVNGGSFVINGKYICLRPEDRLKEHRKIEKMIRNGEKI